jgi:hypothetical protein
LQKKVVGAKLFISLDDFVKDFEQLQIREDEIIEEEKDLEEYEIVKNVSTKTKVIHAERNYGLLCTELKHLYTAITRPRKRLIIFDEDPTKRNSLFRYWNKLDYITVISESAFDPESPTKVQPEFLVYIHSR